MKRKKWKKEEKWQEYNYFNTCISNDISGGDCCTTVIVVWNRRRDPTANPWQGCLHLIIPLGKVCIQLSPGNYGQIAGQTGLFNVGMVTTIGEGKLWIQTC